MAFSQHYGPPHESSWIMSVAISIRARIWSCIFIVFIVNNGAAGF